MFRKEYVTYKYRKTPIRSYIELQVFFGGLIFGTAFVPGVFNTHVTFVLAF